MDQVFLIKHYVPTDKMRENERITAIENYKKKYSLKAALEKKTGGIVFEYYFSSHVTDITMERI